MNRVGQLLCRIGWHAMGFRCAVAAMACLVGLPYWMKCRRCGCEQNYHGWRKEVS